MAIDVSASMLAKDLRPNRLEALKAVASRFVTQRPNDRIGIVVYAGESFTQTPITSDKTIIQNTIRKIRWGQIEDGTAIDKLAAHTKRMGWIEGASGPVWGTSRIDGGIITMIC